MALPEPGISKYTPTLLANLSTSLSGWNLHSTLFLTLLVTLTINKGGMIVDLPMSTYDLESKEKALDGVQAMLGLIFGMQSQRVELNSNTSVFDLVVEDDKEIVVITGLEDAEPTIWIKLCQTEKRTIIWVRDQGSSGRIPGYLIDQFLCSVLVHPEDLTLPPPNLRFQTLITPDYLQRLSSLMAYTNIQPPLQLHMSNLASALSSHPQLKTTLTARFMLTFPLLVKLHRVLAGDFVAPPTIADENDNPHSLGGGQGGVDSWARLAGEEQILEMDWYGTPRNVEGIWGMIRHRIRWREEREEIFWSMKGSAVGMKSKSKGEKKDRDRRKVDDILDTILHSV
ncbi:hypothetical protein P7C73_g3310, partial [Tremellales sp. Uapishka_1]